jgi:hypothetical protein
MLKALQSCSLFPFLHPHFLLKKVGRFFVLKR